MLRFRPGGVHGPRSVGPDPHRSMESARCLTARRARAHRDGEVVFVGAERGGFEPPVSCPTHEFQSCTFNHSVTSPQSCSIRLQAIESTGTKTDEPRRRGDSNPRYHHWHTGFRIQRLQPLGHPPMRAAHPSLRRRFALNFRKKLRSWWEHGSARIPATTSN